jgi:hypothetical protein
LGAQKINNARVGKLHMCVRARADHGGGAAKGDLHVWRGGAGRRPRHGIVSCVSAQAGSETKEGGRPARIGFGRVAVAAAGARCGGGRGSLECAWRARIQRRAGRAGPACHGEDEAAGHLHACHGTRAPDRRPRLLPLLSAGRCWVTDYRYRGVVCLCMSERACSCRAASACCCSSQAAQVHCANPWAGDWRSSQCDRCIFVPIDSTKKQQPQ